MNIDRNEWPACSARVTPCPHRAAASASRIASLQSALELVRVVYNFGRAHSSLLTLSGEQSPAVPACLVSRPLTLLEILGRRVPGSYWRQKELVEAAARC